MFGEYNGWHKVSGKIAYVKDGLVRKAYDIEDESMTLEILEKPCTVGTYKARLWHQRKREEGAETEKR